MDAKRFHSRIVLLWSFLLATCCSCTYPWMKVRYEVTDLGSPGGNSYATAINNNDAVTGFAFTNAGLRAFIHQNGTMQSIAGPNGQACAAFAINDSGLIAGYYNEANGARRAFRWENGQSTGLGGFGYESVAYGMNNAGKIVGEVVWKGPKSGSPPWRSAFVYEAGEMKPRDLYWGFNEAVMDINNNGLMVGCSEFNMLLEPEVYRYIIVFTAGPYSFMYDEEGVPIVGIATSVNDSGNAVGWTSTYNFTDVRAFITNGDTLTKLGTLGGDFSYGSCINASGMIVGYSTMPDGDMHAFVYKDGQMKDLNNLVTGVMPFTVLESVTSINDDGVIVGWGRLSNGTVHAFKARPVLTGLKP